MDPASDLLLDNSIQFDNMTGAFLGGTGDYVTMLSLIHIFEECGAHHMVKARAADDHNGHHRKHNEREPYVHAREDDE